MGEAQGMFTKSDSLVQHFNLLLRNTVQHAVAFAVKFQDECSEGTE